MEARIVCFFTIVTLFERVTSVSGTLQQQLDEYIKRWNGLVKLYRTGKRVGLIEARTLGAQKSTGDVIIVLDAHCECVGSFQSFVWWAKSSSLMHSGDQLASTITDANRTESQSIGCSYRRWIRMEHAWTHEHLWLIEFPWHLGMGISLQRDSSARTRIKEEKAFIRTILVSLLRSDSETTLVVRSPTHAGGLLAIDRQWFFELGAYDPGIRVWGAEQ
jgi:polypeptide N-acetylgalactosaminyltransferase